MGLPELLPLAVPALGRPPLSPLYTGGRASPRGPEAGSPSPETFQKLFDLARGTYETSRYLFYDNAVNDGKGEKAASGDVEPEGAR